MPATSREPWIKVKIGITRSDKILGLPSDSARWGWLRVLAEAKVQRQMGVFGSRAQLVDLLGRHGRYFDDFVTARLLHVAPLECTECAPRHEQAKPGEVIVHDFRREQRDPTNTDRQERWYAEHAAEPNALPNGIPNAEPNALPNGIPNAEPNGGPNGRFTRAGNDGDGDSDESLSEEIRSPQASRGAQLERPDVQALLHRGWKRVTAAQRRVLDEVLDRHNVTGPAWAARIIAETPDDADPLAAVKAADSAWQTDQREAADRAESEWQAVKAAERRNADAPAAPDPFA